ncbi:hypothetical protein QJQ45_007580 [Haematococcus lacustris]|nr:hypothetical protein QJQ45_007580 [Haematococcus lacustris]
MASDAGSLHPDSLPALAQLADSSASVATGHMPMYSLAEGQEFWGNVARYGRYFVTVMLGTGYVMLRPITSALKNPVSAILAVGGLVGTVLFVKVTLELMLGTSSLETFDYVQGQF